MFTTWSSTFLLKIIWKRAIQLVRLCTLNIQLNPRLTVMFPMYFSFYFQYSFNTFTLTTQSDEIIQIQAQT